MQKSKIPFFVFFTQKGLNQPQPNNIRNIRKYAKKDGTLVFMQM